jgi:DNA-binding response OmpR family regulator
MRILLVEDDADLADLMSYALGREGHSVLVARDGEQAMERWRSDEPDMVLLDIGLPKLDGWEVLRRMRLESSTPVIMVTARDEDHEAVRGLDLGADDYVTKPFSAKQLAARVRAVSRRARGEGQAQPTGALSTGELTLDPLTREVARGGRSVALTPLEFRLLHMLALNAGRVVPYARLVEYAWGYANEDRSDMLKSHVSHLRSKLGLPAGGPGSIESVLGVGYRLHRAEAAPAAALTRTVDNGSAGELPSAAARE